MKHTIIIGNGEKPKKSIINTLLKFGWDTIYCADGGANHARELGIIPDAIIGDLDSISKENLKYFQNKCRVIRYQRQNDTDIEKCIKYAIKNDSEEIILLSVIGNRLDHSFCNIGIVLKFFDQIRISIIHDNSMLVPHTGKISFNTMPGELISVYGIDRKTKISSKGLKYKLRRDSLPFGIKESTSNAAIGKLVELEILNGVVFVIRQFDSVKSNDLIF